MYLVCTKAPTADQKNPPVSPDGSKIYSTIPFQSRKKSDHLICSGPSLGEYVEVVDEASFEITAHLLTLFEATTSCTELREAEISQKVVCSGGEMIWRSPASAKNLKNWAGEMGGIDNSAASGGIGLEKGTVTAKSLWADPSSGGTISFSVSASGQSVSITSSGSAGVGPMEWSADPVQWESQLMTQDQLDAFIIANRNDIRANQQDECIYRFCPSDSPVNAADKFKINQIHSSEASRHSNDEINCQPHFYCNHCFLQW